MLSMMLLGSCLLSEEGREHAARREEAAVLNILEGVVDAVAEVLGRGRERLGEQAWEVV